MVYSPVDIKYILSLLGMILRKYLIILSNELRGRRGYEHDVTNSECSCRRHMETNIDCLI